MGDKKYLKELAGILFVILTVLTIAPAGFSAAEVWSDDFEDPGYSGWTVLNGTFSNEDQSLHATGSDPLECHNIQHTSSIAFGSWSFDVYYNSSISKTNWLAFSFIADELVGPPTGYTGRMVPRNGYSLELEFYMYLYRWTDGEPFSVEDIAIFTFSGWNKITITRDETGLFEFYINETLQFDTEDTTHTTGEVFCWSTVPGHVIDNVMVSEPEPTTFAIDLLLIGVGVTIIVGVLVIIIYVRRRT